MAGSDRGVNWVLRLSLPIYALSGCFVWLFLSMPFDVNRRMQADSVPYWDAFERLQTERLWMSAGLCIVCALTSFVAFSCVRWRQKWRVLALVDLLFALVFAYFAIVAGLPVLTGGAVPGSF